MLVYLLGMLGTAVFAITGVLAIRRQGVDVFGAVVLGVVTALGGGTVRDLILDVPIFWIVDFNSIWVASGAALLSFFLAQHLHSTRQLLLYLDGFGAALFGVLATEKVLALGHGAGLAVMMGVWTSIGGGIARDVLASRTNLLMSTEIYATPILVGCTCYVLLRGQLDTATLSIFAVLLIFSFRALAIARGLKMPHWLSTHRERS
ncbi:trimeric intracellular cation channel family protein [Permianibacter sp. IMCC34836]|uniref:trimeric intracellular cation channel family protein n=1 Tax=Permianibacter fluminis TaxID=2738515 RepID=UPI0015551F18|nr:trimeric intracellular cation channel family protein [Permianibacter fluminis]NQD37153.1 trimeric intracellular cation channel family protein [Permianibacter fluminis]